MASAGVSLSVTSMVSAGVFVTFTVSVTCACRGIGYHDFSGKESLHRIVCHTANTAVQLNAGFLQRLLCAAADPAADEGIHLCRR